MPPRRGLVLALLAATQFVLVLDISVATVALPTIRDDLGFTPEDLQWVITGYALTFGGLLLLGGRAADLFGRRRLFVAGLALFVAASLLAGLAQSPVTLIAARLLQGLGGALVSPAALSLLTTAFAQGAERNRAMGVWGAVAAGGGAAGLLLGGALTEFASWRWCFLVNVPVGGLVLAAAPRVLRESRSSDRAGIDVLGALLATGCLLALVFGLTRGEREGFGDAVTVACLGGSVVVLAAFVAVERRHPHPLVRLGTFRRASLDGANLVFLASSAVIAGMPFFGTLYLQGTLGVLADGDGACVPADDARDHGRQRGRRAGDRAYRTAPAADRRGRAARGRHARAQRPVPRWVLPDRRPARVRDHRGGDGAVLHDRDARRDGGGSPRPSRASRRA